MVDDDGAIAAFNEIRRESDSAAEAALRIESLTFGQTYHFLLLMGHWDRNYEADAGAGEGM